MLLKHCFICLTLVLTLQNVKRRVIHVIVDSNNHHWIAMYETNSVIHCICFLYYISLLVFMTTKTTEDLLHDHNMSLSFPDDIKFVKHDASWF